MKFSTSNNVFVFSTIDEQEVANHSFDLIFAFDEIVALGYRESVNLAQIRTFTEMDSHEEKVTTVLHYIFNPFSLGMDSNARNSNEGSKTTNERKGKRTGKSKISNWKKSTWWSYGCKFLGVY